MPHPLRLQLPTPNEALPGRSDAIPTAGQHFVTGEALDGPFTGLERVLFGMGCFWGAERRFWQVTGVESTAVGYAGGLTPNPTYEEVCSGRTGHAEVVRVIFDPTETTLEQLLAIFWESHDPTQGMRQGNDVGTQYRSAVFAYDEQQLRSADQTRRRYERALREAGKGPITTEIRAAGPFYVAEAYHQQYLAKNPRGYCGLGGTGVPFRPAGRIT